MSSPQAYQKGSAMEEWKKWKTQGACIGVLGLGIILGIMLMSTYSGLGFAGFVIGFIILGAGAITYFSNYLRISRHHRK